MKIEEKELGTFEVKDKIIVSDPCYEKSNGFNFTDKAKTGTWKSLIEIEDYDDWGKRVKNLFVCHDEYDYLDENNSWEELVYCGVDSGQLGVFALETYKNDKAKCLDDIKECDICQDDKFYNRMCFLTLGDDSGENTFGGVFKKGVNVSSGFGDGSYLALGIYDGDKLVAVWVNFIMDDEEKEDD